MNYINSNCNWLPYQREYIKIKVAMKKIYLFLLSSALYVSASKAQDINFSSEYNSLRFPTALGVQRGITGV
jgi:hypothetical protein